MLKNRKIQPKLVISFIMVVIMASVAGILGVVLLFKMDSDYSKALITNGFSQGEIGQFNTYLNKGGAVVRDIIMLTNDTDIKNSQKELEEIQSKTNDAFKEMDLKCQTEEEQVFINIIETELPEYRKLRDQVIELGIQNKNEEAMTLFHDQARPVLNTLMNAAESLVNLNVTMGNEVSNSLTNQSRVTIFIIIVVIIVSIFISVVFASYIAKSIAKPIVKVQKASAQLAQGDLSIDIKPEAEDEVGEMTISFSDAAGMMKRYISEISRMLTEVASGNFNVQFKENFKGDFEQIEKAIIQITDSLSNTLNQINIASDQVALGASQLAGGAQNLAEGATEQAGAVEELQATVANLIDQVEVNAAKGKEAYAITKGISKEAEKSSQDMDGLIDAMKRINDTSSQIGNIIAEIEDIASQTNLLSVNAAIEAARAGEAGRGFSVVAEQIGKLADDSARSASNTKKMIETSIKEVQIGDQITIKTVDSLKKLIDGMGEISERSRESSELSTRQAEVMRQIGQGIDQISSVVQNNSAVAEETSATSEELSAQSTSLNDLISQFELKK